MAEVYRLVIIGAPRTKKNHQAIARNAKTGASFIAKDKTLQRWEHSARDQLREQWGDRRPLAGPVSMRVLVYRERRCGDLLNYLAAVSDIIQQHAKGRGAAREILWPGVIVNDVQVVSVDGSRLLHDKTRPRVELELVEVPDAG